ncbi:unnamed protein product [Oncorhynchus mykiss]|uniref:Uncharacterized protein n=1 Tax=Oncorhynchus mykiss TaxID=8022 RepID=A0A060WCW1_ONCMY|nr:unnamed protein product [Oncorhynchus mykiss]
MIHQKVTFLGNHMISGNVCPCLKLMLTDTSCCLTFQVAALRQSCKVRNSGGTSQTALQLNNARKNTSQIHIISEDPELGKFSATYRNQHCFNSHPQHTLFLEILTSLVKNRLCSCRFLSRSLPLQYMELMCSSYLECGKQTFAMEKLVTMTYMFQKLFAVEDQRQWVIESGAHKDECRVAAATFPGATGAGAWEGV